MPLEVKLQKRLKGFQLDVSFLHEGRCMGILGASGCGKSMTLKCIAGIDKPDEGKIILNNKVLYDSKAKVNLKPQVRNVGYLFQNYALFPNMTVNENIGVGLHTTKEEKSTIVKEYLERFHLEDLGKRYPSELSGGQQQRVALARILAYQPDMIMLDEPFSALDSFLKDSLQRELLDILKDYQGEVIIVSHSRDEIYKFCDKLTCMDAGKQILTGSTKDIFINPQIMEAARLTGCKNISPIKRLNNHELIALDWDVKLQTAIPILDEIRYVGIRSHSIQLSKNAESINSVPIECVGNSESPFEYEYIIKNRSNDRSKELLWKVSKKSGSFDFNKELKFITLPKDELMLLK